MEKLVVNHTTLSAALDQIRVVTAVIKLGLRKKGTPPSRLNYEWNRLRETTLANAYTNSVRN